MALHHFTDEHYTHLLARHYHVCGLNGDVEKITDLVAFVKTLHRDVKTAWHIFRNTIGADHDVREHVGLMADIYREYLADCVDGEAIIPSRHSYLKNGRAYHYSFYWALRRIDGRMAADAFKALEWHFTWVEGIYRYKRKQRNGTSKRRYVSGGYRQLNTGAEKRLAALHEAEYGKGMVRPARRARALPSNWDDFYWQQQRCWKAQRRTAKQWQRRR